MRNLVLFLFFILSHHVAQCQLMGFSLPKNRDHFTVPFKYVNDFIVVELVFEHSFPLKFIFDTGSESTILLDKEFSNMLNIPYHRSFQIRGADLETELTAHLIRGVNLNMDGLLGSNLDILVLDKNVFNFEKYTGMAINGILGMDLFRMFAIEVDYRNYELKFHRIEKFKPSSKFIGVPIDVERNKPYLEVAVTPDRDTVLKQRLLMDTGASLALLLYNDSTSSAELPEMLIPGTIGSSLGGTLDGYIGRVDRVEFGEFHFQGVVTNYQEVDIRDYLSEGGFRNGLLGNKILSRFTIVFDLARAMCWMKPHRKYNRAFKYDRSGIYMIAGGAKLDKFLVRSVVPGSPAHRAGIKRGDILVKINGFKAEWYDLERIVKIFKKRVGKRIRLVVERDGKYRKFMFRLQELI